MLGPVVDVDPRGGSGEAEVLEAEDVPVLQAGLGEPLGRTPVARSAIVATATTVAPGSFAACGGVERRGPRGRGVLDDEHPATLDRGALDALLEAVRLAGLADDERVEPPAGGGAAWSIAVATGSAPRVSPPTASKSRSSVRSSMTRPTSGLASPSRVIRRRST